jgi:hypothetical protein
MGCKQEGKTMQALQLFLVLKFLSPVLEAFHPELPLVAGLGCLEVYTLKTTKIRELC